MRLAIVASHPIQYQAPLFRELARRLDLRVFYAHHASAADQAQAGFGVGFAWDIDLLQGYDHLFLRNVSPTPGLDRFSGCDVPEIGKHLAEGRFEALLVMGWHLKCFWQAIWAAKRLGIPVMVRGDSHLGTPRGALKRIGKSVVYPVALRVFDAALWVGRRSREYWLHYGYPAERMFHSPHCVDTAWFAEGATAAAGRELRRANGICPDASVLLFAGKLISRKNPLDVIAAAAALRARGTRVTLVFSGSGALSSALTRAAEQAGLDIVHLGFCNQSEMPAAYAAANVLVLPSNGEETWGLVVNEALACGTPVVVSDAVGCAPEMAAFFGSRAVYPLGDTDALADRLGSVLADPPSAGEIAHASAELSLAKTADGVCRAADAVSSRRRGSSMACL